jgi:hypothetical protein
LNRSKLGFVDAVAEYLAPQLASRRFRCVDSDPYHVRYTSDFVTMDIWHEPSSYELDVRFTLNADPTSKISLVDIVRAELGEDRDREGWFQASTRPAVEHSIQRIAGLIKSYGEGVLNGDEVKFEKVVTIARAANASYTEIIVHGPVREAAVQAWQRRDFATVKRLCEALESDLDEVEARRLTYARKRVG